MICPKCGKEIEKDKDLSTSDRNVYKTYIVGQSINDGKIYCEKCIGKRRDEG